MRLIRFPNGLVLWCLVALAALSPATAFSTTYDMDVLLPVDPNISFPESYFWDINESGLACGTVTKLSSYAGFVGDLDGQEMFFDAMWLRGVNDIGWVTGHNLLIDTGTGQQTVIPPVSTTFNVMWAQSVNNNGIVVGIAAYRIPENDAQLAFIWDAVHGTRSLPLPGAKDLLRINNDNMAVGNIRPSLGSSEAFIYDVDTGDWVDLHRLLNPTPPGYSIASDINDLGVVAGEGWNGTEYRAFTWSPSQGFTWLPNLKGGDFDRVHPTGINASGSVVGYALTATEGWRAFVWDPVNGMHDLNDLLTSPSSFILRRAIRINDAGMIVGDGYWPNSSSASAFKLVPTNTVDVESAALPGLSLQGRPNPFRGSVALDLRLPAAGPARLGIYDLAGRRIASLLDGNMAAGSHVAHWSGRAEDGALAPAGVYFAILETEGRRLARKLMLTR